HRRDESRELARLTGGGNEMNRFQKMVTVVSVMAAMVGVGVTASAMPSEHFRVAAGAMQKHEGHRMRHGRGHGDLAGAALRLPSLRADQRTQIEAVLEQEK